MRIFCVVAYKGTNYYGWEKQHGQIGVQEVIEKAISHILNLPITIYASGRTDAGVHAYGQTFHFDVETKRYDEGEFQYRLNCLLPEDVEIKEVKYLDNEDFHSRYSAVSKEYEYRLSLWARNPFRNEFCWLLKSQEFDMELFKQSLNKFVGKHNYKNFTSKEEDKNDFVREIYEINVSHDDQNDEIVVKFIGSGFMRYQIRFMIGTAVAIASKKETIDFIDERLNNVGSRNIVSYKGQPQGLYLSKVNYK